MDIFSAIEERRSCRAFLPDPVPDEALEKVLRAGTWAPSPMNAQPWHFIVVTNPEVKARARSEAERCRLWLLEKSGWKWLGRYQVDFLMSAPVIVAVVGDPEKTGADRFLDGGGMGYQHACGAAVQNMLLAAHALGLGSLWFTLYDAAPMGSILGIEPPRVALALVCLGKPDGQPHAAGRKPLAEKVTYIR